MGLATQVLLKMRLLDSGILTLDACKTAPLNILSAPCCVILLASIALKIGTAIFLLS